MATKLEVPIGSKFGRLTTTAEPEYKHKTPSSKFKATYLKVVCDCGNEREVTLLSLRNGNTTSCGCYNKEASKKANTTHGLSFKHPLWKVWTGMKARCYSVNTPYYKNYGGRGITVCEEWLNDFQKFYDWGIANGWAKGLQLDRRENDGNYCPENCRFISQKENLRNRGNLKIQQYQVQEIKDSFTSGMYGRGELAEKYNVTRHQINCILKGTSWAS